MITKFLLANSHLLYIQVHPCAPEYPENPDFWAQWRQQLYGISLELSQVDKITNTIKSIHKRKPY